MDIWYNKFIVKNICYLLLWENIVLKEDLEKLEKEKFLKKKGILKEEVIRNFKKKFKELLINKLN